MKYCQLHLTPEEHLSVKLFCIDKGIPIQQILQEIFPHAVKNLDTYDPDLISGSRKVDATKQLMYWLNDHETNLLDRWLTRNGVTKQDWSCFVFNERFSLYQSRKNQSQLIVIADKTKAEIERVGAQGDPRIREQISEYVAAVGNSPPLIAEGLDQGYRKILEFDGYVLAGMEYEDTRHGYQFATWQYSYDRSGVEHGHYYPTWSSEFKTDAFEIAKRDFALRSGLMDEQRHFTDEQLMDIYEVLGFGMRMGLLSSQEENTHKIMKQIEQAIGRKLQDAPMQDRGDLFLHFTVEQARDITNQLQLNSVTGMLDKEDEARIDALVDYIDSAVENQLGAYPSQGPKMSL